MHVILLDSDFITMKNVKFKTILAGHNVILQVI